MLKLIPPSIINRAFYQKTRSFSTSRIAFQTRSDRNAEILHFQQLAPTWWDTSGSQRILHKMNLFRLDYLQRVLSEEVKISNTDVYIPGFNYKDHVPSNVSEAISKELETEVREQLNRKEYRVLDVGCGGGILSESLARLPFIKDVHGIDITPDCITVAKEHRDKDPAIKDKILYELKNLEDIQSSYDIVTMFEMLEHVDNPSEMLRHAWGKLIPGGILFLSTINRNPISWFTTIFMAEQVLGIVPRGTHHIEKYINAREITAWFKEHVPDSHEILDAKGSMYVPTKSWVEHDCVDIGNYIMAVKKLH